MINFKFLISNFKLKARNQRGATIVELLLYMGILAMFLTILTQTFSASVNAQLESQNTSSVEQDGRYIMLRFIYDITRATSITTPAAPGNQGNTLQLTIGGTTYIYSLSGTNLQINDGSVTQLNSPDTSISALTFKRLGKVGGRNSITVSYTVTGNTIQNGGPQIKTFSTTVSLR
jgi:type II secretory pathway pseudopilin PulG